MVRPMNDNLSSPWACLPILSRLFHRWARPATAPFAPRSCPRFHPRTRM